MAQLLQIDLDKKVAELYLDNNNAWQISYVSDHPMQWRVVGNNYLKGFEKFEDLIASDLPEVVKWAAKGIPGIPQNLNGAIHGAIGATSG